MVLSKKPLLIALLVFVSFITACETIDVFEKKCEHSQS